MVNPHQARIMQNGFGCYWEVVTHNREVIARGFAETHAQARTDAERRRAQMQKPGKQPSRWKSAGRDENSADLLRRRLDSLNLDSAKIEPAVMRDLQRRCSKCDNKTLCVHELEDRPRVTSWPKYCPNEQTISALVAKKNA